MTSSLEPQLNSPKSTDATQESTSRSRKMQTRLDLRTLPSIWSSLTLETQRYLWQSIPAVAPIINSLIWAREITKTLDEQDPNHPYKHFPDWPFLDALHKVWLKEPFLFVEKSRTMMASWWAAAETLHYCMTHQPAKVIYWAQDEDRALTLLSYAWTLYEQQSPLFKDIFPLRRPKDRQSYKRLELLRGGICLALPGKDPDKIRSEHPTVVVMDECCFIENGGEAFDVAISSRVPKVLAISSAAPSWFRRLTKDARPIELEKYL
jgi:hypothetical protein